MTTGMKFGGIEPEDGVASRGKIRDAILPEMK
jgi:hypothetical protein